MTREYMGEGDALLPDMLQLETLEEDRFRGHSPQTGWPRIYGGLVIAQALAAAYHSVDARICHSLHAYFLRPGEPGHPILYEVDRIRDGRSFTTRRVIALQRNKPIFSLSASFHIEESSLDHQAEMPDVPKPDDLLSEAQVKEKFSHVLPGRIRRFWNAERAIEIRATKLDHYLFPKKREPIQNTWMRSSLKLPDEAWIHQCMLAYASDMTLLDTALMPHGRTIFSDDVTLFSLDHALWFHRPFVADRWLLFSNDSPTASGGRGLSRGSVFDYNGTLVASSTQEGLIRETEHSPS